MNLWVKEKKKWSKKTQPAAVLSNMFTLYKAAKVGLFGAWKCLWCVGVEWMWFWCVIAVCVGVE